MGNNVNLLMHNSFGHALIHAICKHIMTLLVDSTEKKSRLVQSFIKLQSKKKNIMIAILMVIINKYT